MLISNKDNETFYRELLYLFVYLTYPENAEITHNEQIV